MAQLFACGSHEYGQLGIGTAPKPDFSSLTTISQVSPCRSRYLPWGRGERAILDGAEGKRCLVCPQVSLDAMRCALQPLPVIRPDGGRGGWASFAAAEAHSAAIDARGEVYAWGCSDDGRLGLRGVGPALGGDETERPAPTREGDSVEAPRRVRGLPCTAVQVACGDSSTVVLCSDGAPAAPPVSTLLPLQPPKFSALGCRLVIRLWSQLGATARDRRRDAILRRRRLELWEGRESPLEPPKFVG